MMPRSDQALSRAVNKLKLPSFVKEKPYLVIAGAILFLAVAGGIFSIIVLSNSAADETISADQEEEGMIGDGAPEQAEVLPQQRRENIESTADDRGEGGYMDGSVTFYPALDPFTDPMRLTGTASGGRGGNMAIIESSGTSYIVTEYDYVDDLWSVREIRPDQVILRAHDKEVTLFLDKPPVTRSLTPERDEEEQGEGE